MYLPTDLKITKMRKEKIVVILLYLVLLVFSFFKPTNTLPRHQSGSVTRNISLQTHYKKTGDKHGISQIPNVSE